MNSTITFYLHQRIYHAPLMGPGPRSMPFGADRPRVLRQNNRKHGKSNLNTNLTSPSAYLPFHLCFFVFFCTIPITPKNALSASSELLCLIYSTHWTFQYCEYWIWFYGSCTKIWPKHTTCVVYPSSLVISFLRIMYIYRERVSSLLWTGKHVFWKSSKFRNHEQRYNKNV